MKAIGDRMKNNYEDRTRYKLIRRMPVIIRLDGKAFHTFTKRCQKPFDEQLSKAMIDTTRYLLHNIQGAKLAYTQSDEISILLTDFDQLNTEAWFDYNVQKMTSISAGFASAYFTLEWSSDTPVVFDSRVFNLPKEEVCNYFIWRQKDWKRNSIQMLSQAHFSHKELQNKSTSDMHEMLYTKDVNWADLESKWKNGVTISKVGRATFGHRELVFSQDREFIEKYLINGD